MGPWKDLKGQTFRNKCLLACHRCTATHLPDVLGVLGASVLFPVCIYLNCIMWWCRAGGYFFQHISKFLQKIPLFHKTENRAASQLMRTEVAQIFLFIWKGFLLLPFYILCWTVFLLLWIYFFIVFFFLQLLFSIAGVCNQLPLLLPAIGFFIIS